MKCSIVMSRPIVALLLLLVAAAVAFGLRTWRHWRATRTTGFHGISGPVGSARWFGGVLFAVSAALGFVAPLAELAGWVRDIAPTKPIALDVAAVALVLSGTGGTYWAQTAMGTSWRIGVREDERTNLVGGGPFRFVRNPIFSLMLVTAAGLALLLPNVLALAVFAMLLLAVELQVRFGEEPYLRRTHGDSYATYCREVGRFVPWLGRVR
jgi:protein-S-isoprenylcysteine O-methyltransferase Ste14